MFPLFLHDRRRYWKRSTAHREILQKFLLRLHFQEHNHVLFEKNLLEYVTSIKSSVEQHQKSMIVTPLTIFHYYTYAKLRSPLRPASCQLCPLFNFVLSPFRCGLFCPFLQTLVKKSELLCLKQTLGSNNHFTISHLSPVTHENAGLIWNLTTIWFWNKHLSVLSTPSQKVPYLVVSKLNKPNWRLLEETQSVNIYIYIYIYIYYIYI